MATLRFNDVILKASRRLQDKRTLATDDGSRFSSAVMVDYVNRAVREFLRDKYKELKTEFAKEIPEYVKTSSPITISSGRIERPSDCWVILDVLASDNTKEFDSIGDRKVSDLLTGRDALYLPDDDNPIFYEEGNFINIVPSTVTGNVIIRYIKKHTDIAISANTAENGNYSTLIGTYDATTKRIAIIMEYAFNDNDVNKRILFRDTTKVYDGKIVSVIGASEIVVDSMNLPAGNIAVILVMISDLGEDITDLQFDEIFDGEIEDRTVALANLDLKNIVPV